MASVQRCLTTRAIDGYARLTTMRWAVAKQRRARIKADLAAPVKPRPQAARRLTP